MQTVEDVLTETDLREAARIIATYEGLLSLRRILAKLQADPKRDKMPFNQTQNVALYALYAESHLGKLLVEFKNQAIEADKCLYLLEGVDQKAINKAILLYSCDELITPVFQDTVMNDEVVTWKMVVDQGTAK